MWHKIPAFITAATLIIIWQVGADFFALPKYIAPTPYDVFLILVKEWALLLDHLMPTLFESLVGFFIGNLIAIVLAVLFVHNQFAERALFPITVFINTIPILAIAPILVLIFGLGILPKVIIAALICFFPTLVNMVRGLKAVSPQTLDLMRILSASRSEIFWNVRLQSSLPFLFAALKIATTTCVIGAIVGEWIGADKGLGVLILDATFNFRSALLYASVLMSSGLAVILFVIVSFIEKRLVKWKVDASV